MSRFESRTRVIAADWWDKEETVTIRKFSYGHRQELTGEYVSLDVEEREEKRQAVGEIQVGRMNLAILEKGIVSWTLKDDEGGVVPCTPENIARLTEDDGEYILGEIQVFNPRRKRSPEEQESFRRAD